MTQQELHNQRLFEEAKQEVLRQHTRRHFLKESAMGLGALALGSFLNSCGRGASQQTSSILFDPVNPFGTTATHVPGKSKVSYLFAYGGGAISIGII